MKYGVTLLPTSFESLRQHVRLAESVGFDYIGIADSQSLFRELFVSLTVARHRNDACAPGAIGHQSLDTSSGGDGFGDCVAAGIVRRPGVFGHRDRG